MAICADELMIDKWHFPTLCHKRVHDGYGDGDGDYRLHIVTTDNPHLSSKRVGRRRI
jgi:hypothetical protein